MYKSESRHDGRTDHCLRLVIFRGTLHAWKNVTSQYCRFLTVVIPSEHVKVQETGEILEVTKIPALSD